MQRILAVCSWECFIWEAAVTLWEREWGGGEKGREGGRKGKEKEGERGGKCTNSLYKETLETGEPTEWHSHENKELSRFAFHTQSLKAKESKELNVKSESQMEKPKLRSCDFLGRVIFFF